MSKFGDVRSIIIGKSEKEDTYNLIYGANILNAAQQLGLKELNSVIYHAENEKNKNILALNYSLISNDIDSIAQCSIIANLIDNKYYTAKGLAKEIGKSTAWISKKMSLIKNLHEDVQNMVKEGAIPPRTAEEIAKLPKETQTRFVSHALDNAMSKETVTKLVKLYNDPATNDELKKKIIDSPDLVKLIDNEKIKQRGKKNSDDIFKSYVNNAIKNIKFIIELINTINDENIMKLKNEIITLTEHANNLILELSKINEKF
jgi:ParB/RepB/Spo0J family partition protein